jgi:hypothetical protein
MDPGQMHADPNRKPLRGTVHFPARGGLNEIA